MKANEEQNVKKKNDLKTSKRIDYVKYTSIVLFSISVILSLKYCFTGIHNYLLENHSFRQTQTALTAYYFVKDGFKVTYETPVVGAPWIIPFEFPVYQWVVGFIKIMASSLSLDLIGRIVSLVFYWLSLFVLFKILKRYTLNTYESLFILSFILLHPIYIFWSRTFMIESTVLFFCLIYIYFSFIHIEKNNYISLILALIFGTLAALIKITTFLPFMIFLFGFIIWQWYLEKGYTFHLKTTIKYAVYGVSLFLIPVFMAKIWVNYSDELKSLNPYAYDFISSKKLEKWNFGTFEQKTSLDVWKQILLNSQLFNNFFYYSLIIAIIVAFVNKMKYRIHMLVCVCLYFLAPIIFTNLHLVHDYYTYSNSLFLCLAIGFITVSFLNEKAQLFKIFGITYSIIVLIFFVGRYKAGYYRVQKSHPSFLIPTTNFVKQITKPDDIIIVYGNDWSSEYPYYCERRTISLRNTFNSVKDTAFVKLMKQNDTSKINTLVLITNTGNLYGPFANELINYLNYKLVLQKEPIFIFQKP